jgi:hypothetical protein
VLALTLAEQARLSSRVTEVDQRIVAQSRALAEQQRALEALSLAMLKRDGALDLCIVVAALMASRLPLLSLPAALGAALLRRVLPAGSAGARVVHSVRARRRGGLVVVVIANVGVRCCGSRARRPSRSRQSCMLFAPCGCSRPARASITMSGRSLVTPALRGGVRRRRGLVATAQAVLPQRMAMIPDFLVVVV